MSTGHATAMVTDEDIDDLAHELGVEPEVLLEARLRVLEERAGRAVPLPRGVKRAGTGHYQLELLFPEEIFRLWQDECQRRGLRGSALLRSMVHAYLCGSWEPREVSKSWTWHGMGYRVNPGQWKRQHGSRYPYRDRALMTYGAKRALIRRASRRGANASSIVRALVLQCLDGTWAQPGTIEIVDQTGMYDDEQRYFMG